MIQGVRDFSQAYLKLLVQMAFKIESLKIII